MTKNSQNTNLIEQTKLGRPSFVWQFGQKRRFNLIKKYLDLRNKRVLDIGCGVGMYLQEFQKYSNEVYGIDIEEKRLKEVAKICPNVKLAQAEKLPYPNNFFHIILMHEVIEHFTSDQKAIHEAIRTLKPGGSIVIFAPNKWYFFETHGFYLPSLTLSARKAGLRQTGFKGKYIFRLVPFIHWLPEKLRLKFCPHTRVYTKGRIKKLFNNLPVNFKVWHWIYPGFDKIIYQHPVLGKILRKIFYLLEKTPLRTFGLSIFVIVKKQK